MHGSLLDDASLLQSGVSTVFIHGFEGAAAEFRADETSEFRNPNALVLEVWRNRAFGDFGDVTTDTALFLGQARTMDLAAGADAGASDATNTCHGEKLVSGGRRMPCVTGASRRNLAEIEEMIMIAADSAIWRHLGRFYPFSGHTSADGRRRGSCGRWHPWIRAGAR